MGRGSLAPGQGQRVPVHMAGVPLSPPWAALPAVEVTTGTACGCCRSGAGSRPQTMGYHTVYQGLAERKQGNGAFADSIR